MKKRVLALLLALLMFITLLPVNVMAAETSEAVESTQTYSNWATGDLTTGATYGIYPLTWAEKDMTVPTTQRDIRILISGIRQKILKTGCITKNTDPTFSLRNKMSVEEVLKNLFTLVSAYEFKIELSLKNLDPIKFMKDSLIYTGANGEPDLKDTCTLEQACVYGTRLVTYVYNKQDAGSKGFLWVTKSGGNTVYMLGSIHFASTDIYPFSDEIMNAYQNSDALVEEVNLFNTDGIIKMSALAVYTDGTTLKDHVSAETYQKTIKIAEQLGYPEATIAMLKPWYIYTMFSSLPLTGAETVAEQQQSALLGIDVNLATNAVNTGKPYLEIEGIEYQAKVLDSFSDELEEYLLNDTVDAVNEMLAGNNKNTNNDETLLDYMLDLWRKGDVDTFKKIFSINEEYPDLNELNSSTSNEKKLLDEYWEKLITNRDKGMADYIDKLLKAEGSKTYFVVVGSGHYASNSSALDILKAKGYKIDLIQ